MDTREPHQYDGGEEVVVPELPAELPVPETPPIPPVRKPEYDEEAIEQARRREEVRRDRLAIDALALYCVEGRPEPADPVKELLRRKLGHFVSELAQNRYVLSSALAQKRLDGLIHEAKMTNQAIEATMPDPRAYARRTKASHIKPTSRQRRR